MILSIVGLLLFLFVPLSGMEEKAFIGKKLSQAKVKSYEHFDELGYKIRRSLLKMK